jgi:hypothetical protein
MNKKDVESYHDFMLKQADTFPSPPLPYKVEDTFPSVDELYEGGFKSLSKSDGKAIASITYKLLIEKVGRLAGMTSEEAGKFSIEELLRALPQIKASFDTN